ncbi:MAG: hypothetical protein VX777_00040 [Chlamydiota bacterium]|nr:hypothetical protein [Chlamydiota bacterium]
MQKGHTLEINCTKCSSKISFSLFSLKEKNHMISCPNCENKFHFEDPTLLRQLEKFEKLCLQLLESEEILSNTAVGINVGNNHVKIPYKLLLTRLSSTLDLQIGDQPCSIAFRIEPALDLKDELVQTNR